jgi:hypothetical protein
MLEVYGGRDNVSLDRVQWQVLAKRVLNFFGLRTSWKSLKQRLTTQGHCL